MGNDYIAGGLAVLEEIFTITLLAFILKHLSIQYYSAMALGTFLGVIFNWKQCVKFFTQYLKKFKSK